MGTGISALFTLAVFPFVVFLGDRNRAAAIPLLRMGLSSVLQTFRRGGCRRLFAVFAAADFANRLGGAGGLPALMGTGISALFALAVFPFVVFLGDRNRAAAIPLLRMGLFIGAPNLFAGVLSAFISPYSIPQISQTALAVQVASALMDTGISALFALAVFPFVVFLGDRNRAAAIPLLRMGLFIGAPDLFALMIVGVYFTVFDSADFANGLGGAGSLPALMGTGISALFALAVFPFVVFLGDRNRAAAIPLLRMGLFVGAPNLFAGVVVGVYFAVLGKANITNGLCRTGCGSADMAVANDGSVATIVPTTLIVPLLVKVFPSGTVRTVPRGCQGSYRFPRRHLREWRHFRQPCPHCR